MGAQTLGQKQILTDPEAQLTTVHLSGITGSIGTSYTTIYSLTGKSGKIENFDFQTSSNTYYVRLTVDGVVIFEVYMSPGYRTILDSYKNYSYDGGGLILAPISNGSSPFILTNVLNTQAFPLPYLPSLASPFGATIGVIAPYGVYFKNSVSLDVKLSAGTGSFLYLVKGGYQ